MRERLNRAVSKTVEPARAPRVRIPLSPVKKDCVLLHLGVLFRSLHSKKGDSKDFYGRFETRHRGFKPVNQRGCWFSKNPGLKRADRDVREWKANPSLSDIWRKP